eukprot:TRINITY_DN4933_c0_g1_i1.p1 TRINITY_DN4933_c0_g1~~TRINITY_DN4933_c0_g1_i1.p1  ORF type:complete len:440 (+),score=105.81 TRINITY_DN4933_c0_g1_i1:29-1348(+)
MKGTGLPRMNVQADIQRNVSPPVFSDEIGKNRWADRLKGMSTTSVWTEFTPLAVKHGAVNLGQGFPDFEGSQVVLKAAQEAIKGNLNQYSRAQGHLRLVSALAKHYGPLIKRELDPMTNFIVTMGATEGLFSTINAVINPGDEVILIEPFYDSYPCDVVIAGGVPKYIPLKPSKSGSGDWKLDLQELEEMITPKSRLLVINTPQNIPGKVWSERELEDISNVIKKHPRMLVLSDEVYETMVYDENKHVRMASIPGMFDRTITLGSAGKSFSVTGWKTGWAYGPKDLIDAIYIMHQNTTFCSNTPCQDAVATGFEEILNQRDHYFEELKSNLQKKRDRLCSVLSDVGLAPVVPQGSYFVLADISKVKPDIYINKEDTASPDFQFCRWLTKEIGVAAIPPTAFYSVQHSHVAQNFVRFCFIKKDETLEEAARRLQKLKNYL